jgi:hypothetical protein
MVVDFQHHYPPPELMETGKGDGTLLLDEAGNSNYRFNLLLADLSAHVRMMDKAGWQTLHLSTRKNCSDNRDHVLMRVRLPHVTSVELGTVRRPSNCSSRKRRNGLYLPPHASGRLHNFRICIRP